MTTPEFGPRGSACGRNIAMTEQNATKAPEAVQGDWKAKASEAVQESWKVAQEKAGKAAVATNEAVQLWVVVPVNKGVAKAGEVWKAGLPPWMTEMWSKKLADMSAFAKTYTDRVTTTMNLWGDKLKLELLKYTSETTLRYLGVGLLGCGTLYLSSKMVFGGKGKRRAVKSSSRGLQLGAANGEGNGQPSLRRSMVPSEAIQSRTPAMKVALKQLGLAPGDSVLVVLHSIEAAEVETWCSACGAKAVYVDSSVVPSTDFIKDYVTSLRTRDDMSCSEIGSLRPGAEPETEARVLRHLAHPGLCQDRGDFCPVACASVMVLRHIAFASSRRASAGGLQTLRAKSRGSSQRRLCPRKPGSSTRCSAELSAYGSATQCPVLTTHRPVLVEGLCNARNYCDGSSVL
eukprot:2562136-Rhodomonas_salina.2